MSRILKTVLVLCFVAAMVAPAAAVDKIRVSCVGDSITKGVGAAGGKDYPSQLQGLLGAEYQVGNFGASGRTLHAQGGKHYFGGKYWNRAVAFRPNVVVFMLGTNDGKKPTIDKDAFLADCRKMLKTLVALPTKPQVFVCTPIPVIEHAYGISGDVVRNQVTPLIVQVAKELKLPIIDCYAPLKGKDKLIPDNVHPNAQGAAIIAKTIADAIKAPAAKQGKEVAASTAATFPGKKSDYKGFRRYDFEVDGRKAFVIVPAKPATGKPWAWRARFAWLGTPDDAVLKAGLHVAHIDVTNLYGSPKAMKHYEAFYALMTGKYGLSKRPALTAASRGGLAAHNWAALHPDRVSCIAAVAPVCDINSWPGPTGLGGGNRRDWPLCLAAYGLTAEQAAAYDKGPLDTLEPVVKAKIPILHVYSPNDEMVPAPENTLAMVAKIKALGGTIETFPIEFKREDLPKLPDARVKAIAARNPKALGWAHTHTIGSYNKPEVATFILKHAK